MSRKNIYSMIDELNKIRSAAGLAPRKIVGTCKQAVQIEINNARRGEFE